DRRSAAGGDLPRHRRRSAVGYHGRPDRLADPPGGRRPAAGGQRIESSRHLRGVRQPPIG
ncbi:hypothetical protein, partial [Piscirickettsia salmonis]|uniref:hypothetical protein n=1 Tax=Piscirickettsia salmonis TaxID=1238 RepID=UPI001C54ED68